MPRAQWRWFLAWCLAPSLAVLIVVTLAPTVYLVATSFTPLNLTNPRDRVELSPAAAQLPLLLGDERLSQFAVGAGEAVLLDGERCRC